MAASLLAMVCRLSVDRAKYEPYTATHQRAITTGDSARRRLLELADKDARAYLAFSIARKMPRETATQQDARESASRAAARDASEVPLLVVRECARVIADVQAMAGRSNLNASSDLAVAARLSVAAARGAAANVLINLPMVADERFSAATTVEVDGLLEAIDGAAALTLQLVSSGTLREPEDA